MSKASKQNEAILDAAIRVFMRYGIRRTTMADIAGEAGLARQTLYTVFSNKEEVFCAAIRYSSDRSLSAILEGWRNAAGLGDKLDIYFQHAIIASHAIIRATPDAADMIGGYNEAGKAEIAKAQTRKKEAIAGILAPHEARIAKADMSIDQFADFIQNASMGIRDSARDEKQLKSLLAALKTAALSVVGEGPD